MRLSKRLTGISACLAIVIAVVWIATTLADSPANEHFQSTWARTDQPIADGHVSRTWMWGPDAFTGSLTESYMEAPNGQRTVQYFDKSRMEITTDIDVSPESHWYVTNGLLVVEMISGRRQLGDNMFEGHPPADINVAGDTDDPHGPTYATFSGLLDSPAAPDGSEIIQRIDREGYVWNDAFMTGHSVFAAHRVTVDGIDHQVASPFWEFMNSSGLIMSDGHLGEGDMFLSPFYATGYPITEAYWASVKVGGDTIDVLIQCFERRCLTFTPGNDHGWQVEAGNVGRHYYDWRYPQDPSTPDPTAPVNPTSTPTVPAQATPVIPTPVPQETATTVPTDPPLSQAYLNPVAATRAALEETCDCDASANNPIIQRIVSRAYTYRHQYHLATANNVSFNRDTTNFYPWLVSYLEGLTQPGWAPPNFRDHLLNAIYQRDSAIGIQIRRMETGDDPLFAPLGSGPEVYWTYLIDPTISMHMNPFGYDAQRSKFTRHVEDYQIYLIQNPSSSMTFGDYLASIGFSL